MHERSHPDNSGQVRWAVLLALVVAVAGAATWWFLRTPSTAFVIHRDLEFAKVGEQSLLLDLYIPTDRTTPPPVVIWLHGGAWQWGDKQHNPLRWLALEGYAIVTVDYRLSGTATFPAAIHDCKAVVRWLRANQDRYGFDARRVVAAGSSAGGHLATLLGVTNGHAQLEGTVGPHLDQSSEVHAIIDYFGPADLTAYQDREGKDLTSAVALFIGNNPWEVPELARLASPLFHLDAQDPPILILHATADPIVDVQQSQRLHEACIKLGIDSQLVLVESNEHDAPVFYDEQRRQLVRTFLHKHLPRSNP